ncbi:hypothetical protein GCM10027168_74710 [Streptomyces capparidis]
MTVPPPVAPAGQPPPPLVVCALRVERLALRGAGDVLRTGMGPRAAGAAVRAALRGGDGGARGTTGAGARPVVSTGFCAGLAPGLRPGTVFVATEVRGPAGSCGSPDAAAEPLPCPGADRLADLLRRRGRTVVTGPMACADHIVRGAERAALGAGGAVAVDMESAAVLRAALAAGPRPVAVVRVVVDTPEHELLRPGTLRTGAAAYRSLRACAAALRDPALFHPADAPAPDMPAPDMPAPDRQPPPAGGGPAVTAHHRPAHPSSDIRSPRR